MSAVAVIVTVLLAVAGGLTLTRIIRGPSILDRAVATDVLLAVIVAAIATEAAYSRDATALPVLVVLAVLGFVGSVSVARFAARRDDTSTSGPSDGSRE
ncbi:monovalent cation/H+ antiporter complex subunit F [Micromonospora palythoicola]|uniref:monovalent cation/H+ antiporter complex subunit F n=1 Tax=Micromonospora palythoicola TaxID=3120507 RepID=UPI002FCE2B8C